MHKQLQPEGWKQPSGYANGMVAEGKMVFLAGQVGWNENEVFEAVGFAAQVEQALRNIVTVLAEAGARPEHLVRLTWFVTDKSEYLDEIREVGAAYRRVIGRHFPAMSLVEVSGLIEEGARVEIEATAVLPGPSPAA
jgi:enamine deaminase RidA (YjgF/YER057c/UK114 family)